MGKTFVTSRKGSTVLANYNNERTYTLSFDSEKEAEFFDSELISTQEDYNNHEVGNTVRKKCIFANPADCSVKMNFDTENIAERWPMKVKLSSIKEMKQFFDDIVFAIWGPLPSI